MGSLFDTVKSFFSSLFIPSKEKEDKKESRPSDPVELSRPFTLTDDCNRKDPLFKEMMEEDLKGRDTPLKLMKHYADILNKETSHGNVDEKLDRLFLCGKTPQPLGGYYHGITISVKTGTDSHGVLDEIRKKLNLGDEIDPLQVFYSSLLSTTSPWAGKNFKELKAERLSELTEGFDKGEETTCLGINSFRKDNKNFINNIAGQVLSAVIEMEGVPGPETKQRSWIYAKGGLFIAKRQKSVDPDHPEKEVMALNYRWKSLGNKFPNRLLIDEIVEIAEGLFLGKLYYATSLSYIAKDFEPQVKKEDYKYRSFGYFLLMDDSWLHEKNTLFPELTYKMADNLSEKFGTFHLIDSPESKEIQESLKKGETVLHYLQELSRGVKEEEESEEKYFKEIDKLFMCGQRPDGIQGFLHGGVVAFKSSGFLKKLGKNILNDLWPAVRPFSPWTGKTFTTTSMEGIRKYIGNDADYYKDTDPIVLGTNTYRKDLDITLPATAFIEHLDKIGMVVEYPDEKEKDEDIYVKSFYFIAENNKSVSQESSGKEVLQFNYRWPEFRTMPPDCLCIDELVRVAEGLYLGQLLYATAPTIEYSPEKDSAVYKYENFGYFMLMDDEWYAIKEFIAFDTE
jgi:hypothetical protein